MAGIVGILGAIALLAGTALMLIGLAKPTAVLPHKDQEFGKQAVLRRYGLLVLAGVVMIFTAIDIDHESSPTQEARSAQEAAISTSSGDALRHSDLMDAAEVERVIAAAFDDERLFDLEIRGIDKSSITFAIRYRALPDSRKTAEIDCRRAVLAILSSLKEKGHSPAAEWLFIAGQSVTPKKGVTGEDLVVWHGSCSYNFNNDSIEWEAK